MGDIEEAHRLLVGAWRLIAFEDRDTERDDWTATYGTAAVGLAIYDPSGSLSIQVMPDPQSAEPYLGYFGTFEVLEAIASGAGFTGIVDHRVEGATDIELVGPGGRPFELSGQRLLLGDDRTWRRILERIT